MALLMNFYNRSIITIWDGSQWEFKNKGIHTLGLYSPWANTIQ